jgi:3-hydroxyisobutyrate dehydrogenase
MGAKIGLVGVGRMGINMAANLVKNGFDLTVYDLVAANVQEAVKGGAKAAKSTLELAQACDTILTSLPGPAEVEAVYLGKGGILEGAKAGTILLDTSSIDPGTARKVAEAAQAKGVTYLDSPVSGGTVGAKNATLTVMVGGDSQAFQKSMPVFQAIGKNITNVGPVGAGCVVKICNQMLVGITTAGVSEAMVLGTKWGVDPKTMYDVLSTGFAGSTILSRHVPNFVLKGSFEPGFTVNLLSKDVTLATGLGRTIGVPLPVTGLAGQILEAAKADGLGDKDMSSVIRLLEKLCGVEVRSKG